MALDGDNKQVDAAVAVRRQRTTHDDDDNNHQHQTTFPSLCTSIGIDTRLRKALTRMNLVHPTLVQSKAIPLAISSGRDLLVRARTGSGKTLAYCIPVLQRILARKILLAERGGGGDDEEEDDDEKQRRGTSSVGGVILVPTRELCDQVSRVLDDLSYYCADVVKVVTLSSSSSGGGRGGGSTASNNKGRKEMLRQEALLRDRPDVIVATPAGLVAYVRSGVLDLKRTVETLVVDEADLILSFGEFVDMCVRLFPSL